MMFVPDEPSATRDELAMLRAANARLRQVAEAKGIEIPALRAAVGAGQARPAGAGPAGRGGGQVWDIPPVRLEKVHWLLPQLRCGGCGKVTCADPPDGRAGTVVYGPNVNAAAILLGSEGNVPVERTAMLM